jgi:hypothetical protein
MSATAGATLQANTKKAFAELQTFLSGLDEGELTKVVDGGWTVSTILAHLAFWDRWVENRWRLFKANGAFDDLPDMGDLINPTAEAQWMALPPSSAKQLSEAAAESLNRTIQSLDATAVAAAVDTGREHLVDRSRHWNEHMDQLRRTLA